MVARISSGFALIAAVFGVGLAALLKRFRDHELPIFERNGMHAVLYSVAAEPPLSENTFVYILEHKSRDSARKGWAGRS